MVDQKLSNVVNRQTNKQTNSAWRICQVKKCKRMKPGGKDKEASSWWFGATNTISKVRLVVKTRMQASQFKDIWIQKILFCRSCCRAVLQCNWRKVNGQIKDKRVWGKFTKRKVMTRKAFAVQHCPSERVKEGVGSRHLGKTQPDTIL